MSMPHRFDKLTPLQAEFMKHLNSDWKKVPITSRGSTIKSLLVKGLIQWNPPKFQTGILSTFFPYKVGTFRLTPLGSQALKVWYVVQEAK